MSVHLTRMRYYCDLMIPSAVYYAALRVAVRARCAVAYLVGCACKSNGLWSNNSTPSSYTVASAARRTPLSQTTRQPSRRLRSHKRRRGLGLCGLSSSLAA